MKKVIAVFFVLIVLGAAQLTAFAHGHHGNGGRVAQNRNYYYTCPYNDCVVATNHVHNGVNYYGHHNADGHAHCAAAYGSTGNNGYYHGGGCGYYY